MADSLASVPHGTKVTTISHGSIIFSIVVQLAFLKNSFNQFLSKIVLKDIGF